MTPLRQRMIDDMTVRGLAENTKKSYLNSVTGLARHYRRSPVLDLVGLHQRQQLGLTDQGLQGMLDPPVGDADAGNNRVERLATLRLVVVVRLPDAPRRLRISLDALMLGADQAIAGGTSDTGSSPSRGCNAPTRSGGCAATEPGRTGHGRPG